MISNRIKIIYKLDEAYLQGLIVSIQLFRVKRSFTNKLILWKSISFFLMMSGVLLCNANERLFISGGPTKQEDNRIVLKTEKGHDAFCAIGRHRNLMNERFL